MDPRLALPEGTLLDSSYRIERQIGSGGFGITYVARDLNLETFVAIKEYFPGQFGQRDTSQNVRPISRGHEQTFQWGRDSFVQEARTLARFRHPSVVQVTRVFEANATAYMVMALEKGQSFETWLKGLGRKPTQAELDAIVAPLLDALAMMHAESFLHRDIAPDNIIVRADGSPVLLDFGAARRAIAEQSKALTGIVKGGYSPQEQYATDGRLQGAWTDIYALGATLYRAVSGIAPDEATTRVIDDRVVPASKIAAGSFRQSFLDGIDACLKVRPSERPQSIAELKALLFKQPPVATRAISSTLAAEPEPPRGGMKRVAAALVAIIALAGAVGGAVWYQQRTQIEAETLKAQQEQERLAAEKVAADLAQKKQVEEEARKRAEAEDERRRKEAADNESKQQDRIKLADVVPKVRPAVVDISVTKKSSSSSGPELGTGFFISADGYIVTSYKLVETPDKVEVSLSDNRKLSAKLIGTDPRTDLALLKVDAGANIPFVKFSTVAPRVGDWALPAVSLSSLDSAPASGAVATLNSEAGTGPSLLMQIDAAIDVARVGGPTFNGDGDVIGLNTIALVPSGQNPGMVIVVPANIALAVIEQVKKYGDVRRGWLGVKIQNVDQDTASAIGLATVKGALLSEIVPDGPAAKAGLRVQDAVIAIDGQEITDSRDLARRVADYSPGATVDVRVWRNNSSLTLKVKLGQFVSSPDTAQPKEDPIKFVTARLGVTLAAKPAPGGGIEVVSVESTSDAQAKGIEKGHVILEIAGNAVANPDNVADAIKNATLLGRKAVMLYIRTTENRRIVPVALKHK